MNRPQIEQWFLALGSKPASMEGTEWIHGPCPFAQWEHERGVDTNPSFGVKVGPGESQTYCLACGAAGGQYEVMLKLRHLGLEFDFDLAAEMVYAAEDDAPLVEMPEPYEHQFEERASAFVFPDWLVDVFEPAYFDGAVHPYLAARNTPYEVAEKLDLRFDSHRQRVIFPVYDWRQRLRGLHGRAVCLPCGGDEWEQNLKYKMYPYEGQTNPHIWLGEHWADGDKPLVVAESVFDLARVLEVYPNAISPLTATMSAAKAGRLKKASRVITLFDEDKAGEKARAKLSGALTTSTLTHIRLPEGTDAGNHTAEEIWYLISPHV